MGIRCPTRWHSSVSVVPRADSGCIWDLLPDHDVHGGRGLQVRYKHSIMSADPSPDGAACIIHAVKLNTGRSSVQQHAQVCVYQVIVLDRAPSFLRRPQNVKSVNLTQARLLSLRCG